MSMPPEKDCFAGAMTLLSECMNTKAGQRLLIVCEPAESNFYDPETFRVTAAAARALGLKVYSTETDSFLRSHDERCRLFETLSGFDHVVFFSRVGDQIRFAQGHNMPSATMCYTLDLEALASDFGTACYHGMCEIKDAIDRAFFQSRHVRALDLLSEVTLKRFPMLVSRPVPAMGFSGKIALSRFLVGTGSCLYEPYFLPLSKDIFACIENNAITHFEGDGDIVVVIFAKMPRTIYCAGLARHLAIRAYCIFTPADTMPRVRSPGICSIQPFISMTLQSGSKDNYTRNV